MGNPREPTATVLTFQRFISRRQKKKNPPLGFVFFFFFPTAAVSCTAYENDVGCAPPHGRFFLHFFRSVSRIGWRKILVDFPLFY